MLPIQIHLDVTCDTYNDNNQVHIDHDHFGIQEEAKLCGDEDSSRKGSKIKRKWLRVAQPDVKTKKT